MSAIRNRKALGDRFQLARSFVNLTASVVLIGGASFGVAPDRSDAQTSPAANDTTPGATEGREALSVESEIRQAVERAIPWLEKGSHESAEQRQCFTCHNQALPVIALVEARRRGFPIDEANLARQLDHTAAHLERGRQSYLDGSGQGGKILTAGYALWTLEAGGRTGDETTSAVTKFLLTYQRDKSHWSHGGTRPPSSGSDYSASYVALRGLAAFGTDEQRPEIDSRVEEAARWVLDSEPRDTEDHVFRLRSLEYVKADESDRARVVAELLALQRDDGGWGQTPDMESDAYATATSLAAILETETAKADDPPIRRAIRYLLDNQLDDGTWRVVTRAKPIQVYYESGFPHAKDQFISITATAWAVTAFAMTLPASTTEPQPDPAPKPATTQESPATPDADKADEDTSSAAGASGPIDPDVASSRDAP